MRVISRLSIVTFIFFRWFILFNHTQERVIATNNIKLDKFKNHLKQYRRHKVMAPLVKTLIGIVAIRAITSTLAKLSNTSLFSMTSEIFSVITLLVYLIVLRVLTSMKANYKQSAEIFLCQRLNIYSAIYLYLAQDLIETYVALELNSLTVYILLTYGASRQARTLAVEAALKYFFYSILASILFLRGILLIYNDVQSLVYSELIYILKINNVSIVTELGAVCCISTLCFKLGLFPFSFWVAGIYESIPYVTLIFFATVAKLPVAYLFRKLGITFYSRQSTLFQNYIASICIFSVLYSGLRLYRAQNVKEFIGYSSIGQFAILAALLRGSANYEQTRVICARQLANYSIPLILFLQIVTCIEISKEWRYKFAKSSAYTINLNSIFYILSRSPVIRNTRVLFTILNLAGLPPFLGFFIKLYAVKSLFIGGNVLVATLFILTNIIIWGGYLYPIYCIVAVSIKSKRNQQELAKYTSQASGSLIQLCLRGVATWIRLCPLCL